MSDLQMQAMDIISHMSEEKLSVLVKFMQIFIQPGSDAGLDRLSNAGSKRIGIAEGEVL